LIKVFIPDSTGRITTTALLRAKDAEMNPRGPKDLDHGLGYFLIADIIGPGTTYIIKDVNLTLAIGKDGDVQTLYPVGPSSPPQVPWIAVSFHTPKGGLHHGRETALHQNQVTSHFDDFSHMFDAYRAYLHAGPAAYAFVFELLKT